MTAQDQDVWIWITLDSELKKRLNIGVWFQLIRVVYHIRITMLKYGMKLKKIYWAGKNYNCQWKEELPFPSDHL